MGSPINYPFLVIPYRSNLRKLWNLLIILIIYFDAFWIPIGTTFLMDEKLTETAIVIEIITFILFALDMLVNMRTTYSDENNEEIVDTKMLKNEYMKSRFFFLDLVTVIPIGEIYLLASVSSGHDFIPYFIFKLIRLLRLLKLGTYFQNVALGLGVSLIRTFISFCLMVSRNYFSSIK